VAKAVRSNARNEGWVRTLTRPGAATVRTRATSSLVRGGGGDGDVDGTGEGVVAQERGGTPSLGRRGQRRHGESTDIKNGEAQGTAADGGGGGLSAIVTGGASCAAGHVEIDVDAL
jgi:hypothetical protein